MCDQYDHLWVIIRFIWSMMFYDRTLANIVIWRLYFQWDCWLLFVRGFLFLVFSTTKSQEQQLHQQHTSTLSWITSTNVVGKNLQHCQFETTRMVGRFTDLKHRLKLVRVQNVQSLKRRKINSRISCFREWERYFHKYSIWVLFWLDKGLRNGSRSICKVHRFLDFTNKNH